MVLDAVSTLVDPNSRISFAVALPFKHSRHTAKVLEALIDGLTGTIKLNTKPNSLPYSLIMVVNL